MNKLITCLLLSLLLLLTACAAQGGAPEATDAPLTDDQMAKLNIFQYVYQAEDGQFHGFVLSEQVDGSALFAATGIQEITTTVDLSILQKVNAIIAERGVARWPTVGAEDDAVYSIFMEWSGGASHTSYADADNLPEGYEDAHAELTTLLREQVEAAKE